MSNYSDKDFFKDLTKEGSGYEEQIQHSFPYVCLKIFWDDLSQDALEEALRGLNTNEDSIDAFFIDENNKEINIIQCKPCLSVRNKRALKKEWLSFLNDVPNKLENHSFIDVHRNPRLKEIAEEYIKFRKKGYKTKLHFFHLGNADKNTLSHYAKTIKYYGWADIKDEYQEYLSKLDRTEPPSIEFSLDFDFIEPRISDKHKTLVSIITGDEIVRLREQHRYKLFDKNLRFGLGKNKINTVIANTAKSEPENFYFYNNGITITSKGFKYKQINSKLKIEFPQIINGAQTVNAIYEAYKEKKNELSRRNKSSIEVDKEFKRIRLLFRVIQDDSKDGKKTTPFEEKVIRYNNSQNSIKEADFYANEPEQIKFQELFAKYGYFYEIKRGDRKYLELGKEEHNLLKMKKRDFSHWEDKIDMEKLALVWMAYKIDPGLEKVTKGNIFGHAQGKYYDAVFEQDVTKITDEQVKEMILAWNLSELINDQSNIYGGTTSKGQIISKTSQFSATSDIKTFNNIQEIVYGSFLFGNERRKDFSSKESLLKEKDKLVEYMKKYHFFSGGRYLTLATIKLILDECSYKKVLIEHDLYQDKKFLNEYLIKAWLKTILDDLFREEHKEFENKVGSSLQSFYKRNSTWRNIQARFSDLRHDKDKPFTEIFKLDLTSVGQTIINNNRL